MSITMIGMNDHIPTRPGVRCYCGQPQVLDPGRTAKKPGICQGCFSTIYYNDDEKPVARKLNGKVVELEVLRIRA